MKTTSLKLLGLLLLAFLSATPASRAQGGRHPHEGRPGSREVKAYYEASVLPALRQQRQKLEEQLAAPDRTQLATYRTQLKALRQKGQALHQSLMPTDAPQGERPSLADAQREQLYQLHKEMRGIMLKVSEMARKYSPAITELSDELQPQKEKWATDTRAIVFKNASPEQQQRMAGLSSQMPERGHGHGYGEMQRFFRPSTFLLLEPAAAEGTERTLGATSFYPNPATATSQLSYEVKKAGPVTINLLDKNGSQLRTLLSEPNAEQGAHTQPLNLSDLPAGTYYYQIITNGAKETKRFVKE